MRVTLSGWSLDMLTRGAAMARSRAGSSAGTMGWIRLASVVSPGMTMSVRGMRSKSRRYEGKDLQTWLKRGGRLLLLEDEPGPLRLGVWGVMGQGNGHDYSIDLIPVPRSSKAAAASSSTCGTSRAEANS